MRAFRPIDHLFFLTLCGLLFVVIALQYYRPSSYLPQSEPKPATYKADSQQLADVFQLIENWDHAHEVEDELKILPSIPPIPSPKEIEEKILQKQLAENPDPQIKFEDELEKDQAKSWWLWLLELFQSSLIPLTLVISVGILLIIIILRSIFKVSLQKISKTTQRDIYSIPLGVKRKQYQIAGDFQVNTVAQDWLEEIEQQEIDYIYTANRGENFEVRYEDYLKMVVNDFQSIEKQRPKHSQLEKTTHSIKKWIKPELQLGEKFEFKYKWSDLWATISSAGYNALVYLLTPDDIRFVWLYLTLYFTFLFLNIGLYRRSRWFYILGGIVFSIVGAITGGILWIYNYMMQHPELFEVDQDSMNSLYRNLGIGAGILVGLFLLNRIYRFIKNSKFGNRFKYYLKEPIWLKDASMGNVGLLFFLIAFLTGRLHNFFGISFIITGIISAPFWAAGILNVGLWLFSPTPKQKAEEQWKLPPYQLAIITVISASLSAYVIYEGIYFGVLWWFAPVPAISAITYYLLFYRMDKMPYLLEKDEAKKGKKDLAKTVETDAKKLVRKTIPQAPKTPPTDRWWDIEKPKNRGMLHLENRMLRNSSSELDHLLRFRQLRFLYLKNNLLEFVPEEIIWLKQLRKLDLSNNKIGSIPPSIQSLKHLAVLELAQNQIRNLPPWIDKMSQLKVLNIRGNMIPKAQVERLQKALPNLQIEWD